MIDKETRVAQAALSTCIARAARLQVMLPMMACMTPQGGTLRAENHVLVGIPGSRTDQRLSWRDAGEWCSLAEGDFF